MRAQSLLALLLRSALLLSLGLALASRAEAQPAVQRVSADAKGAVGGGILGAEIGFMTTALLVNAGVSELDEAWAYILFPSLGAVGGAVAGYFILEDPTQTDAAGMVTQRGFPEVSIAVLAVSLALIVPTFVGVLALTAYDPGRDQEPGPTSDDEGAEAGSGRSRPRRAAQEGPARRSANGILAGGPGLFRWDRGALLLGLPIVRTRDAYAAEEHERLSLRPQQDLEIPLMSGVF